MKIQIFVLILQEIKRDSLKTLKKITRWMLGIVIGITLLTYLFLALPFCQRWIAGKAADILSEQLGTRVEVGRVQLGITGHAVIDDVDLWDRQDQPMLHVTRTGAKLDLMRLIQDGDIIINSAQLYGATAHIRREHPDSAFNFQFIIDAFKKEKKEKKPLPHIEIRSIQVRHTNLTFDQEWQPRKEEGLFDPNHISLSNLSVSAALNVLTSDTLNVELDRLSFKEQSGLKVNEGQFLLTRGRNDNFQLTDLHLALPSSHIDSKQLTINAKKLTAAGTLDAHIDPTDLTPVYPPLANIDDRIDLSLVATGSKSDASLSLLKISDERGAINLSASAVAHQLSDSIPALDISINQLSLSNEIEHVISPLVSLDDNTRKLLTKLGNTQLTGNFQMDRSGMQGEADISSSLGNITANGSYRNGAVKAHAEVDRFNAGTILNAVRDSSNLLGTITAILDADCRIKGTGNLPEGNVKANITEAQVKGYTYHGITADLTRKGNELTALLNSNDPAAKANAEFHVNPTNKNAFIEGFANIENLDLASLHLGDGKRVRRLVTKVGIDLHGSKLDNMEGNLSIPHVIISDADTTYTLTHLQITSQPKGDERHVHFTSPYATAQVDGEFDLLTLGTHMQQVAHRWLPNVFKAPATQSASPADISVEANVIDLEPLHRLTGVHMAFTEGPLNVKAHMNSQEKVLNASASAPKITLGQGEKPQTLSNLRFNLNNQDKDVNTTLHIESMLKKTPAEINVSASTKDERFNTDVAWIVHQEDAKTDGKLSLRGTLERNATDGLAVYADILPTELHINDTLWNIKRSQLYFRNKELYVDGFQLAMFDGDRYVRINGTASADEQDSMFIKAKDINLEYIFMLAKVKPLTMGGYASGDVVATHVFKNAHAVADVFVPTVYMNGAPLGTLKGVLTWGNRPGNLDIHGTVTDAPAGGYINVNGWLHVIKDPDQKLDLEIDFRRANSAFIQRYVNGIFTDFSGRSTGRVRVFGTFKNTDMEGDVLAHDIGMTVPMLNVRYHTVDQWLHMTPGVVRLDHVKGYDKFGEPGKEEHSGIVDGEITMEYFRNMHYHFDITANNILAYDTHEFSDLPFYCTAYGTGSVSLSGGPGYTNVDVNVTPNKGTTLTYNSTSPETLTQARFVSFVDRSEQLKETEEDKAKKAQTVKKQEGDMRLNFNMNITPEAQLRVLMDARTGDMITLYGSGNLLATYYNKGKYNMYGTYHVDHGTYSMAIQEVIQKNFQIRKGGTLTFTGEPYDVALDLNAIYTVPSVSLNDLSAKGTFSNNTVRVNCVMNIGGVARQPQVTFDFDIPNVNEDELRMVRSLISTEEERNLQVIYLLGLGRFYTYDYTATNQTQSTTAVNSLLSSTLSGQLNSMFSTIIGRESNWNFGANLSTGTMGWSDMDVEGMLSGRLLNNRLLINGNFGYRDNPVAQSNFVGDFDIQYLLNKPGNFILKAYSETNDRYFTKSSLYTQGIGFMAKRDFNTWRDLFPFWRKNKEKKTTDATTTE